MLSIFTFEVINFKTTVKRIRFRTAEVREPATWNLSIFIFKQTKAILCATKCGLKVLIYVLLGTYPLTRGLFQNFHPSTRSLILINEKFSKNPSFSGFEREKPRTLRIFQNGKTAPEN